MAPISILPHEILREIFLYFQPDPPSRVEFPKAVVQLSAVCRYWRRIILSISHLWTQVVYKVARYCDNQLLREHLSWLKIFLKRSGSLPLDITLEIYSLDGEVQSKLFEFLMIKAPFHRWRSLELYCPFCPSPGWQSTSLTGEFSSLTSLSYHGYPIGLFPLLPIINRSANQLRQLYVSSLDAQFMMKLHPSIMGRISALITGDTMVNLNLPSNITKLHVRNLPLYPLPHIVSLTTEILSLDSFIPSRFPNLRVLEVTSKLEGLSRIPISIPSLRCLIFRTGYVPALDLIRAPSLESIQFLYSLYAHGPWLRGAVNSSLYDISPVDLILEANVNQNFVIIILSKSPRVKTLTLRLVNEGPCEWLVEALSERANGDERDGTTNAWKLCTHLITLRIKLLQDQKNTEVWTAYLQRILRGRDGSALRSIICEWQDGNEMTVSA
jgi:hypothetical protein